jgi:hypothetical protein
MPMLDVFKSDVYGVVSLTAAINKLPFVPSRLGQLGVFKKKGVTTTSIVVEEQRGKLFLVPTAARGSNPNVYGGKKRQARSFVVPHVPLIGNVFADDVQNIRAFGSETEVQAVADLVNDKLQGMRQALETTLEWMRIGAINGLVYDADGIAVIYNWFTEFGITPPTTTLDFTANGNKAVKMMCNDVRRKIEDALGMSPYTGIRAICGTTIYDVISGSTEVNHAYFRPQDSAFLRESHVRGEFTYGGVTFEEYRGKIGTLHSDGSFIPPTQIYFFPEGTTDIFQEIYAPANFVETVNTMGKPVYAKQRPMDWEMGIELHCQTNPLVICTRPGVLINLAAQTGVAPAMVGVNETSEAPANQSIPEHLEEGTA